MQQCTTKSPIRAEEVESLISVADEYEHSDDGRRGGMWGGSLMSGGETSSTCDVACSGGENDSLPILGTHTDCRTLCWVSQLPDMCRQPQSNSSGNEVGLLRIPLCQRLLQQM